jgi:hypothetical protein
MSREDVRFAAAELKNEATEAFSRAYALESWWRAKRRAERAATGSGQNPNPNFCACRQDCEAHPRSWSRERFLETSGQAPEHRALFCAKDQGQAPNSSRDPQGNATQARLVVSKGYGKSNPPPSEGVCTPFGSLSWPPFGKSVPRMALGRRLSLRVPLYVDTGHLSYHVTAAILFPL